MGKSPSAVLLQALPFTQTPTRSRQESNRRAQKGLITSYDQARRQTVETRALAQNHAGSRGTPVRPEDPTPPRRSEDRTRGEAASLALRHREPARPTPSFPDRSPSSRLSPALTPAMPLSPGGTPTPPPPRAAPRPACPAPRFRPPLAAARARAGLPLGRGRGAREERRHVRGAPGPETRRGVGTGREQWRARHRKGYTLRRCPISWIRLAACWRYDSSMSASTPQRRLGVFSSCSRVKNQREEAPRPDAMTLPPPPAPSAAPLPSRLADSSPRPRGPAHSARPRPRAASFHPAPPPCACAGAARPARASSLLSFFGPRWARRTDPQCSAPLVIWRHRKVGVGGRERSARCMPGLGSVGSRGGRRGRKGWPWDRVARGRQARAWVGPWWGLAVDSEVRAGVPGARRRFKRERISSVAATRHNLHFSLTLVRVGSRLPCAGPSPPTRRSWEGPARGRAHKGKPSACSSRPSAFPRRYLV